MPGPMPKEHRQRARDTRKRDGEFVTVTNDGELRGPALTGNHEPATFEWYENYRRSPQAQMFVATDWQRLLFVAPLVDRVALGIATVAERAELRLTESLLGGTYGDRLKLRIRIARDDTPTAPVRDLRAAESDVRTRMAEAANWAERTRPKAEVDAPDEPAPF